MNGHRHMNFGSHLRDLRKRCRMTQQQLADAVGIDFTYLSKIENDRVDPPSQETIRKLASALEVNADDLILRAGKVDPALKVAAAAEPQLALLLRTVSRKRLTPDQYRRMQEIAEDGEDR
jgi:HTH-type transcriptional regulator, competence development regulator